ncbi:MAG TPA: glycosyltransferase family 2 protein, partial [Verrucomicrobiae bacterium]
YVFFLNNDTWLEPECIERLLAGAKQAAAEAANPQILNYDDDSFQSLGAAGFDVFGLATAREQFRGPQEVFMPEGCAYLVRRDVFRALGGFDAEFFMFADETDLSWRLWLSGHRAVCIPAARLHHRGAANVNPAGGDAPTEFRTSDTKRFFANRNGLLVLLKNAQHLLLLCVGLQLLLLAAEAVVALALVRRWSFVRRAYLGALQDCWRLRAHILAERKRIKSFRRRSDWWMLRFLDWRPNRWEELKRMRRSGVPRVSEG